MFILHDILEKLKNEFPQSSKKVKSAESGSPIRFMAIIVPFASSQDIVHPPVSQIPVRLYRDTAKTILTRSWASPKIPWKTICGRRLWENDSPTTDAAGGCCWHWMTMSTPKTGKKIFGCEKIFDHAAKQNQSKYPWAQNVVTVGTAEDRQGTMGVPALELPLLSPEKRALPACIAQGGPKLAFTSKMGHGCRHDHRCCRGLWSKADHRHHRFLVR